MSCPEYWQKTNATRKESLSPILEVRVIETAPKARLARSAKKVEAAQLATV